MHIYLFHIVPPLNMYLSFCKQSSLFHFFFISSFGISNITFCPEFFIFCQFLHDLRKVSVQSTTLYIAIYGVQPLFIYLDNRMIVCKLSLFSAF